MCHAWLKYWKVSKSGAVVVVVVVDVEAGRAHQDKDMKGCYVDNVATRFGTCNRVLSRPEEESFEKMVKM